MTTVQVIRKGDEGEQGATEAKFRILPVPGSIRVEGSAGLSFPLFHLVQPHNLHHAPVLVKVNIVAVVVIALPHWKHRHLIGLHHKRAPRVRRVRLLHSVRGEPVLAEVGERPVRGLLVPLLEDAGIDVPAHIHRVLHWAFPFLEALHLAHRRHGHQIEKEIFGNKLLQGF